MTKFYLTTAIDYVNGAPHIGHAYEKIQSDVLIRHFRQRIDDVYFGAFDKTEGAVCSAFDNIISDYYAGIMEDECTEILEKFFKKIRQTDT